MQTRKNSFTQRTFNQAGSSKSYSQHYPQYNQQLQENYNQGTANGANAGRVIQGFPPNVGQSQPQNIHLRQHQVQQALPMHSASGSVNQSNQNLGLNNQVPGSNAVTSAQIHEMPIQASGMPMNSTNVHTMHQNVPLLFGNQQPSFYPQMPNRGMQTQQYYLPNGSLFNQQLNIQYHGMGHTRPQYAAPMAIPQSQGYQTTYQVATNMAGVAPATQPMHQPPSNPVPKPMPTETKSVRKNRLKIINPETGLEIDLGGGVAEAPAAPVTASGEEIPHANEPTVSDAAQEFATKVAAVTRPDVDEKQAPQPAPVEAELENNAEESAETSSAVEEEQAEEVEEAAEPTKSVNITEEEEPVDEAPIEEEPLNETPTVPVVEEVTKVTPVKVEPSPKAKSPKRKKSLEKSPVEIPVPAPTETDVANLQFGNFEDESDDFKEKLGNAKDEEKTPPQVSTAGTTPAPTSEESPAQAEAPEIKDDEVSETSATEEDADADRPFNPEDFRRDGVLQYDRSFIMSKQRMDACLTKPTNLPQLEIVRSEPHSKAYQTSQVRPDFFPFPQSQRGSQQGGYNRNRSQRNESQRRENNQGPQQRIITLNISESRDFSHRAAQPWKPKDAEPGRENDPQKRRLKEVNSLLNKISFDNLPTFAQKIAQMGFTTEKDFTELGSLIFKKAASERHFSKVYADLVTKVEQIMSPFTVGKPRRKGPFHMAVIKQAQNTFEYLFENKSEVRVRDKYDFQIEEAEKRLKDDKEKLKANPDDPKLKLKVEGSEINLEETKFIASTSRKNFRIGTLVFVGHLFRNGLVQGAIVLKIMENLAKVRTELNIDCLNKLMKAAGKEIHQRVTTISDARVSYSKLIMNIKSIGEDDTLSARTQCLALEILELKDNDWVPLRKEEAPSTVQEIHAQARAEELQKEAERFEQAHTYNNNNNRRGPPPPGPNEWNVAGNTGRKERLDLSRVNPSQHVSDQEVNLRPAVGQWGGGSSGGFSSSSDNRFAVLQNQNNRRANGQRQVAGSTRSTPGPTTERRTPPVRGTSQERVPQSNKDSASKAPIKETPKHKEIPVAAAATPDVVPSKPTEVYTTDKIRSMGAAAVDEFVNLQKANRSSKDDIIHDITVRIKTTEGIVTYLGGAVERMVEQQEHHRKLGQVFSEMVKMGLLSKEIIKKAISDCVEMIDDFKIDFPYIYKFFVEFLVGLHDPIGFPETAVRFTLGEFPASEVLFSLFQTALNEDVDHSDLKQVQSQLLRLLVKSEATQCIEYIRDTVKVDKTSKEFVHTLAKCVFNSCLEQNPPSAGNELPFDNEKFTVMAKVLQFCIDNNPKLELECVYALQAWVVELNFPLNLFGKVLVALYDFDVIVEETIYEWYDKKDDDHEGKGVCSTQASRFVNFLRSTPEQQP